MKDQKTAILLSSIIFALFCSFTAYAGDNEKIQALFTDKPFVLLPATPELAVSQDCVKITKKDVSTDSYASRYGAVEEAVAKSTTFEVVYWLINTRYRIQSVKLFQSDNNIPWSSLLGLELENVKSVLGSPDLTVQTEDRIEYYFKAYYIDIHFIDGKVDYILLGKQI